MTRAVSGWLLFLSLACAQEPGIHAGSHLAVTKIGEDTNMLHVRGADAGPVVPVDSLGGSATAGDHAPTAFDFNTLRTFLKDQGFAVLAMSIGLDTIRVQTPEPNATDAIGVPTDLGWIGMAFRLHPAGGTDTSHRHVYSYVLQGSEDPAAGLTPVVMASGDELFLDATTAPEALDQHLPLYVYAPEVGGGDDEFGLPMTPTFFMTFDPTASSAPYKAKSIYRIAWDGQNWGCIKEHLDLTTLATDGVNLSDPNITAIDGLAVDTQTAGGVLEAPILISPRLATGIPVSSDHEILFVGKDSSGKKRILPYAESKDGTTRRLGTALSPGRGIGDFSENDPLYQTIQIPGGGTDVPPPTELDAFLFASRTDQRGTRVPAAGVRSRLRDGKPCLFTQVRFTASGAPSPVTATVNWRVENFEPDSTGTSGVWKALGDHSLTPVRVDDGHAHLRIPLPSRPSATAGYRRLVAFWQATVPPTPTSAATRLTSYRVTLYF